MTRSSLTLESDTVDALEDLPVQVQSHAQGIKDVLEDGTWSMPPELSYRFADSLLSISEHTSKAQILRQAAECYFAFAQDVIRAAERGEGYASLASDAELSEVRAAMVGRSKGRAPSYKG